ncbi:MAG: phage virion morphogenesis protein [Desulfuromonadales bacterium]|nr:phage virion morphogenesis protein [Desulfuromonadales bacterium]
MLQLRIQLASADALLARFGLARLSRRLETSAELLAPAVPVVARAIERNFEQEGRPLPWAPLAPDYARRKARRFGPGLKILQRSGRLRRSITTRVEGDAIVASTDVAYAPFHQFGTRFLPARPFLVLTESDKEEVARAVARSLESTAGPREGSPDTGPGLL